MQITMHDRLEIEEMVMAMICFNCLNFECLNERRS